MRNRILGFDGLRAIAVTLVFIQHKMPTFTGDLGLSGVQIFFSISGFLIISILYEARQNIEKNVSTFGSAISSFLAKRTLRIFPIYYVTLFILAILAVNGIDNTDWNPNGFIFNILYLSNIWIGDLLKKWPGQYSHLWSLSIEEQFYIIAAPIFLFIGSIHHKTICLIFILIGFTSLIAKSSLGFSEISIYNDSLINFSSIALGGYAGLHYTQSKKLFHNDMIILSLVVFIVIIYFSKFYLGKTLLLYANAATPLFSTLLVYAVCTNQTGIFVSLLENRFLAHFGRISYGFYLYHNFIHLNLFQRFPYSILSHAIEFIVILAVADLSWRIIERRCISYGRYIDHRILKYSLASEQQKA